MCEDGLQNQDETGIDCGGVCTACPTCDDNTQNQDETDIDCGGVCDACPTCFDLIQNQNETGIDCGDVCEPCQVLFVPVSLPALNKINCVSVGSIVPNNVSECKNFVLSVNANAFNYENGTTCDAQMCSENITYSSSSNQLSMYADVLLSECLICVYALVLY
eukprot:Awhi_evm1s8314